MPRGRPKLKATDTRGQPSVHRRVMVMVSHSPSPAPLSTHAEVEDVGDDVARASDEAVQVTHEAAQARNEEGATSTNVPQRLRRR